jgi:hypothetical protein
VTATRVFTSFLRAAISTQGARIWHETRERFKSMKALRIAAIVVLLPIAIPCAIVFFIVAACLIMPIAAAVNLADINRIPPEAGQ